MWVSLSMRFLLPKAREAIAIDVFDSFAKTS
jgi:hypothetical protein